jgi:hypothetical protein
MYPKGLVQIPTMTVSPGHTYTADVATNAGVYTLMLTDNNTGSTFTAPPQTSKRAQNASIEWIMEGPGNGLLTDFGNIGFTSASGTINGQTATVGSFGAAADAITMVSKKKKNVVTVRAAPAGLSDGSFGVNWQHA